MTLDVSYASQHAFSKVWPSNRVARRHNLPTLLNILFFNLPSFHKHCSNEKPFRAKSFYDSREVPPFGITRKRVEKGPGEEGRPQSAVFKMADQSKDPSTVVKQAR